MRLKNKTVLVAGASSGIGREVAMILGQRGNNVIVTARRFELLESLSEGIKRNGGDCLPISADALLPSEMERVMNESVAKYGKIDAALINIGDGPSLDMSNITSEEVMENLDINYRTFVNSLMPLIFIMKKQKFGLIAQTNSLAGFLGLPKQGPYSAAKAACRTLMDTCRVELKPWNIKFCTVYPGFVATERVSDDGVPAPFEISETEAANQIIFAMENEKSDYLFPFPLRWLIRLARVLPKTIVGKITFKMMNS